MDILSHVVNKIMPIGDEYDTLELGDWELQNGGVLPNTNLAYKTYGDPNSPAIVYPTWFSGSISDNVWLIGEDKTLKTSKYFIIIPALFGNGQSSSPSNHPTAKPFPKVSVYDNVRAQHELVTKHLGIKHLRAVLGWSMGALQTYQWATQYPNIMDMIVPFCGSARTSIHNQVFLEGVKSAMLAAKGIASAGPGEGGVSMEDKECRTWSSEEKDVGMKAFGRGYAGWGFSQAFYREKLHKSHYGYQDLESFMKGFWEKWACSKDPDNILVMLATWQNGDCSRQEPYNGNFEMAMQSIKAKALVLPCQTDLYFPPEDSEYEVANMRPGIGDCIAIPSIWGHWAGGPGDSKDDMKWIDERIGSFFSENAFKNSLSLK